MQSKEAGREGGRTGERKGDLVRGLEGPLAHANARGIKIKRDGQEVQQAHEQFGHRARVGAPVALEEEEEEEEEEEVEKEVK